MRANIETAFKEVVDRYGFEGGALVANFEKNFSSFGGVKYAMACANGTDALKLRLMAAGEGPGDEVITAPNTFIATTEGINLVGATFSLDDIREIFPEAEVAADSILSLPMFPHIFEEQVDYVCHSLKELLE